MISILARDPLWAFGFALLVVGLGTQVLALTVAPIDIVQAIAACGISLFLVLSHFVLRERLSKFEYVGIAAILVSLLLLGFSVDAQDDLVTSSTSAVRVFSVAIPALIGALVLFVLTDQIAVSSVRRAHIKAPLFGISSGLLYGVAGLGVKEVSTIVKQYGLIDAAPRVFASPGFYLFLGSTVLGFLVFQTALQRTTASVFVPVNTVTSSCYFIIAGTVLFHERLPTAAGPLALRLGAFFLILLGLLILAASRSLVSTVSKPQEVVEVSSELTPLVADTATIADCDQRKSAASQSVQLMLREFSSADTNGSVPDRAVIGDLFVPLWRHSGANPLTDVTSPFLVRDRLTQAQLRRRRRGGEVVVSSRRARHAAEDRVRPRVRCRREGPARDVSPAFVHGANGRYRWPPEREQTRRRAYGATRARRRAVVASSPTRSRRADSVGRKTRPTGNLVGCSSRRRE